MRTIRYALLVSAALLVYAGVEGIQPFANWPVNSLLLAVIILAVLFMGFEQGDYGAREIAVVGALAAVGAAGRVLFAAVPSVQPATFIAILAGYVFGAEPGFMVGALIALLSNIFLGQGPWTPWQMLAWGLAGASGGLLATIMRGKVRVVPVAILCVAWGFIFGWMMNFWFWLAFVYPLTLKSFLTASLTSFWFDFFHAAGNLVFALLLTRPASEMLLRFRARFSIEYIHDIGEKTGIYPADETGNVRL
jgi:energy-coupling factor transport system substrate-specific component